MAWPPSMKQKLGPPMNNEPLSLSLSYLVVCWGSAMDFGVWFVGGLLVIGGFLILVCWRGGGDFAMDFGFWFCYGFWLGGNIDGWVWFCYEFWVLILLWILGFDFAMDFGWVMRLGF